MKVLIIDDEPFIVSSIKKILEGEGFQTVTASDKKTALQLFFTENPDLVITDIMLPFSGGFDIIEEIKSHPQKKSIPVIVVTGMDENILLATKNLANDCLTKPFTARQLLYLVKKNIPAVQSE
jgi:two-component system, OmpR family, response regulator VicR